MEIGKPSSSRKTLVIVLVAVLLIAIGFFIWIYRGKFSSEASPANLNKSTTATLRPDADVSTRWSTKPFTTWGEHFKLINETTVNDDNYIMTYWNCGDDIYGFDDLKEKCNGMKVTSVEVYYRAKCQSTGCGLSLNSNILGRWQTSVNKTVTGKWSTGIAKFNGDWDACALNNLTVKIRKNSGSKVMVSQLYAVLKFSDSRVPTPTPIAED